jgi:hypothetical protein
MSDDFWKTIGEQLDALTTAGTVGEVLAILPAQDNGADGFFEGGGGDGRVDEALRTAGWRTVVWRASYYWVMESLDGELLTYVEGDVYRGNKIAEWAS